MPELPEVETVMRGLQPALEGRQMTEVLLRSRGLRFPFPEGFRAALEGRTVQSLRRRAKYILAALDDGATFLIHLGMTGRFTVTGPDKSRQNLGEFYFEADEADDGPHAHVAIRLDDGTRIVFTDPRRFGVMDLISADALESHKLLRGIGIEPLGNEFNDAFLLKAFAAKKAPLKSALLDQRIIAGLGNIYVSEVLFRAGLSPRRKAGTIVKGKQGADRVASIIRHTRDVLNEAIAAGGSTLQDFAHADGAPGSFQQRLLVYDREGEPCLKPGCTGTIKRIVQSGRSSFYCPVCQR
jgi:formamidopyrimidine-DNA glycosylase